MSTVFEIGGEKFNVVKKGIAQARQLAGVSRWLAQYGTPAFRKLTEGDFNSMAGMEIAVVVLGAIDESGLLDLFQIVFGCNREIAEAEFDISLTIDGLVALYNGSPTIKKIADRFFSGASFGSTVDSSSTPSEAPTAG